MRNVKILGSENVLSNSSTFYDFSSAGPGQDTQDRIKQGAESPINQKKSNPSSFMKSMILLTGDINEQFGHKILEDNDDEIDIRYIPLAAGPKAALTASIFLFLGAAAGAILVATGIFAPMGLGILGGVALAASLGGGGALLSGGIAYASAKMFPIQTNPSSEKIMKASTFVMGAMFLGAALGAVLVATGVFAPFGVGILGGLALAGTLAGASVLAPIGIGAVSKCCKKSVETYYIPTLDQISDDHIMRITDMSSTYMSSTDMSPMPEVSHPECPAEIAELHLESKDNDFPPKMM